MARSRTRSTVAQSSWIAAPAGPLLPPRKDGEGSPTVTGALTRHCVRYAASPRYTRTIRTSSTIGFAVDEADRPRLDHLAEVFAEGNRSAFLRVAMRVMERYERALRFAHIQAYGAERLAESGHVIEDFPDLVAKASADPSCEAAARADLVVAEISRRSKPPGREPSETDAWLRDAYTGLGPPPCPP